MTGADLLLECLETQGVRVIFGMPGTQNLPIYDALYRRGQGMQHYLVRHEQSATLMANGFARASGEVGVALTVPGPGASNAATGIGDACTDCVPVLLITGGYERRLAGRDRTKMFHGLDQAALFRPITRYFGCPQSPAAIPEVVEAAFRAMLSGRAGPAVIEVAPDVAAEDCESTAKPIGKVQPAPLPAPDPQLLAQGADRLSRLSRPVIFVGGDCIGRGAGPELVRLAETLQAPLVFGRLGKGAVDDQHPVVLGHCRTREIREFLRESDGLLAVGTRFTQIDTMDWQIATPPVVVQIDREQREIGREYPAQVGLVGDLRGTLEKLAGEIERSDDRRSLRSPWSRRAVELKRELAARPSVPVLSQIRQALPPDGILVGDVTTLSYRAFDQFPVPGPRQFLYPCHYVTLGFAFPAALGAKVACPDRPVVALCGDGGFLMGAMELALAVERQITVVAVVVTDRCLTAIKGSQLKHYQGRTIATDMHVPDFVRLAQSFGAQGERAASVDEVTSLVAEGLGRAGPTVIEVPMADRVDELVQWIPWL